LLAIIFADQILVEVAAIQPAKIYCRVLKLKTRTWRAATIITRKLKNNRNCLFFIVYP
jgi:hypothetical protein